jgi:hypothetical protein
MRIETPAIALALLLASSFLAAQNYELGFSPGGSSLKDVLDAIASAKSSLRVACYEFTSREIATALEAAAHRGVEVRIVADFKASGDRYSQTPTCAASVFPSDSTGATKNGTWVTFPTQLPFGGTSAGGNASWGTLSHWREFTKRTRGLALEFSSNLDRLPGSRLRGTGF